MNDRDAFLKHLAANEDDAATRLVYADWLDERGEHEESTRQRAWPAAKAWLVNFCEKNNPTAEDFAEYEDDEYLHTMVISPDDLIEMGRAAVEALDADGELSIHCGINEGLCCSLRDDAGAFWKNWSILTGIPVPPDAEEKSSFSCAC